VSNHDPAVPQQATAGQDAADAQPPSSRLNSSEPTSEPPPAASAAGESSDRKVTLGPDVGTADPTDNRRPYDWVSHYPDAARSQIRAEACYVVALLIISLVLTLISWMGLLAGLLGITGDSAVTLKKYAIYTSSGLLGGAVFGNKYLYRVVARGYWHQDRKLWRYLSPLNSAALAYVMGAAVEASFLSARETSSTKGVVVFGFLVGYFADQAISKLYDIATVVFGATSKSRERSDS
jgi:hypothetical protein